MSRDLLSATCLVGPGTETAQLREALRDVIASELGIDIVSLGPAFSLCPAWTPEMKIDEMRRAFG